jgi:hypothetical protein
VSFVISEYGIKTGWIAICSTTAGISAVLLPFCLWLVPQKTLASTKLGDEAAMASIPVCVGAAGATRVWMSNVGHGKKIEYPDPERAFAQLTEDLRKQTKR